VCEWGSWIGGGTKASACRVQSQPRGACGRGRVRQGAEDRQVRQVYATGQAGVSKQSCPGGMCGSWDCCVAAGCSVLTAVCVVAVGMCCCCRRNVRLSFSFVYPDRRGQNVMKEVRLCVCVCALPHMFSDCLRTLRRHNAELLLCCCGARRWVWCGRSPAGGALTTTSRCTSCPSRRETSWTWPSCN
jgi:hypothetical protein